MTRRESNTKLRTIQQQKTEKKLAKHNSRSLCLKLSSNKLSVCFIAVLLRRCKTCTCYICHLGDWPNTQTANDHLGILHFVVVTVQCSAPR